jgi:zinc transport system substrate-binding protein
MRIANLAISTFLLSLGLLSSGIASADVKVSASIKPIHSLVASVMQGMGEPALIVDGSNSPHTYTLKPSDASTLEQAQVVFWVGHELESFLEKPLETLGQKATKVALIDTPNIQTLAIREDEHFKSHNHGNENEHDAEKHGDHELDAHIWLDPENAKAMLKTIAETLSKADPDHASIYVANATETERKLDELSANIKTTLATSGSKRFIVFHDAYQYFENRFGIKSQGALSIHPETPPGAKQIAAIKQRISDEKIQCVFSEPQFETKMVDVVREGTEAKSATLDPMGANLNPGPNLYETLLTNLARTIAECK